MSLLPPIFFPDDEPTRPDLKAYRRLQSQFNNPDDIPLFGLKIPEEFARLNTFIIGRSGTGKSVVMRTMASHSIRQVAEGNGQAVLGDVDCDLWPFVRGIAPNLHISTLNPPDSRCHYWDLPSDFKSRDRIWQLANSVIPEKRNADPFWVNMARMILVNLIVALSKIIPNWRLHHLIAVAKSVKLTKKVLTNCEETKAVVEQLKGRTGSSIHSELIGNLIRYDAIANAWGRSTTPFTIDNYFHSNSVLLLGFRQEISEPLKVIYKLFLDSLVDKAVDLKDAKLTRIYIDELQAYGPIKSLITLGQRSRKNNISVAAITQDIANLTTDWMYGDAGFEALIANFGTLISFRLGTFTSAKWYSNYSHEVPFVDLQHGFTSSQRSHSFNANFQKKNTPFVHPNKLLNLPMCDPHRDRVFAYMNSFYTGLIYVESEFLAPYLSLPMSSEPGFIPRPPSDFLPLDLPPQLKALDQCD